MRIFRREILELVGQDKSVVVARHEGFYVKVNRFRFRTDSYIDIIPEASISSSNNSHTSKKQSNNWPEVLAKPLKPMMKICNQFQGKFYWQYKHCRNFTNNKSAIFKHD